MATVKASDGSTWGFARAGRTGGRPVVVHHGLIGDARLDPDWIRLADKAGIEWITIERPGYGATPARSISRIADWPRLIAPVLAALNVDDRFDVLGVSAGAPYAYALAAGLPDRVRRVFILSGVPFVKEPDVIACYSAEAQHAYAGYAKQSDAELRQTFAAFCRDVAERLSADMDLAESVSAIMRQDCAGPAREAKLQATDWGFERAAVRCPVHLWHAREDDMVPFDAARRSAAGLRNATFHVQKQPSHIASIETMTALLSFLAA